MRLFDKKKSDPPATPAPGPLPVLKVGDFMAERAVLFLEGSPGKQEVLNSLVQSLSLLDPQAAMKAVLAREEAGSTVLEPGLFVPHARLAGLTGIHAALAVIPAGLRVMNSSEVTVRLALLFVSPAERMKDHLAFLAGVAALFQDDGLRDGLTRCRDAGAALAMIRAAEASR